MLSLCPPLYRLTFRRYDRSSGDVIFFLSSPSLYLQFIIIFSFLFIFMAGAIAYQTCVAVVIMCRPGHFACATEADSSWPRDLSCARYEFSADAPAHKGFQLQIIHCGVRAWVKRVQSFDNLIKFTPDAFGIRASNRCNGFTTTGLIAAF
jgi:hypothetical protein